MCNHPNFFFQLDLVIINAYRFGNILLICSQDIEQKEIMTEGMTSIAPLFSMAIINSLPAMQCHLLLITFATSLDPDQAQQNVWPDMGPNCMIL